MHHILNQARGPPFASMHDSGFFSKMAGVLVEWTRPAIFPTLVCAFEVSSSSQLSTQETSVMIAERQLFPFSFKSVQFTACMLSPVN